MKISVVIPVKNRPEVIHRAIDSALAQTLKPHEIVVVDDGSTDNTPDEVARRATTEPIKLIRLSESGGAPKARNAGAKAAEGNIIALLDSDDAWEPGKLAAQAALLEATPQTPAVFTDMSYVYANRAPRYSSNDAVVTRQKLFFSNCLGGSSTAMIRREAFEQVGGFRPEMPSCQDWELWLRLAALGDLHVVNQPLTQYYFDGGGRITKNLGRVTAGHNIVFEEIYALIDDEALLRRVRAAHMHRYSEIYSRQNFKPLLALKYAFAAIREEPSVRRIVEVPRVMARLAIFPLT